MMTNEIKNLVEASAVPLLTQQIDELRRSNANLSTIVFRMEKDLAEYIRLTSKLTEELNYALQVRTPKSTHTGTDGKVKYYRDQHSVAERWKEWKILYEQGESKVSIARRWGVDRRTLDYAISKKFVQSPHKSRGRDTRNEYAQQSKVQENRIGNRKQTTPQVHKSKQRVRQLC